MERILQRKHYDFDTIENVIRSKGFPGRISDRREKSNFRTGTYPQIFFMYNTVLSVTFFNKICDLPRAGRLQKTLFLFHLEWKSLIKCKHKTIANFYKLTGICFANLRM